MRRWMVAAFLLCACGDEPDPPACPDAPGVPPPPPAGLDPAVEARVDAWLAQMSLEEKVAQMHGIGPSETELWLTAANERLGIPGFAMTDGPRGVTAGNATCFPVGMARGASFDRELERAIGAAVGLETAAKGGNVILAPTVNVLRHPAWGRAQETYGEDPFHLGEMGIAFVDGAQQHVIATAKHFAVNSIEDTRFDVDVTVDERTLREVYLPQFEALVTRGKVGAVMSAYNQVNGLYASENPFLLHDVLKTEWGFAGPVMSDWFLGVHSGAPAAAAGLDIEMPNAAHFNDLAAAVGRCDLSEAVIDDAVRRILRTKLAFGLDAPAAVDSNVIESAEHAALALRAARASMVLLRNEGGALPLDPGGADTYAVVGALAGVANLGDTGSSSTEPSRAVTPLDGMRARFGDVRVLAMPTDTPDANGLQLIGAADAAVVVVGLTADDEGENLTGSGGDRETLALSPAHVALIEQVAAANPRTIVVLEGGSAILTSPWLPSVEATLMAWYPGQEGGTALAELLAGDVAPSGRLPISFPAAEADLPPFDHTSLEVEYGALHGYRWLDARGTTPAFPFGFGLSYGAVTYDALTATRTADTITATITITSIDRRGDEVVQLYVEPPPAGPARPPRELRAFTRIALTPAATTTITLTVPLSSLAIFDATTRTWSIPPGTYTLAAGPHSRDLPLRATVAIDGA
jgi:beta-glucosidase